MRSFEVCSFGVCISDQETELNTGFVWYEGKDVGMNVRRDDLRVVWHVELILKIVNFLCSSQGL